MEKHAPVFGRPATPKSLSELANYCWNMAQLDHKWFGSVLEVRSGMDRKENRESLHKQWSKLASGRWFPSLEMVKKNFQDTSITGFLGWHPEKGRGAETEHLHWYHLCSAYSKSKYGGRFHCGCNARKSWNQLGFTVESRLLGGTKHLENALAYLQKDSRRLFAVRIEGRDNLRRAIQLIDESKGTSTGLGQASDISGNAYSDGSAVVSREEDPQHCKRAGDDDHEQPWDCDSRRVKASARVEKKEKILNNLIALIETTRMPSHTEFECSPECLALLGPYKSDMVQSSKITTTAWKMATSTWNTLSFRDIIGKRENDNFTHYNKKYYSIEYSFWLMLALLKHQGMQADDIQTFFDELEQWFNRLLSKRNCLCILGPPSCGKTYFADTIITLAWNSGTIINPTKTSAFEFENALHKRIVLWNEAHIHSEKSDYVKELLEGHRMPIQVKYLGNQILTKTPIVITANFPLWQTHPNNAEAFKHRMLFYQWKSAPWLKNCLAYPHPLWWKLALGYSPEHYNYIPHFDLFNDNDTPDFIPVVFFDKTEFIKRF